MLKNLCENVYAEDYSYQLKKLYEFITITSPIIEMHTAANNSHFRSCQ